MSKTFKKVGLVILKFILFMFVAFGIFAVLKLPGDLGRRRT